MTSEPPAAAPGGIKQGLGHWREGREREGEHEYQQERAWLCPQLTWPQPGLLELLVDEVHLVQATLNLLDAVGRDRDRVMEESNSTEQRGREGLRWWGDEARAVLMSQFWGVIREWG